MRTRTDRLMTPAATAAGSLDPLDLTVAQADLARALRLVGRAVPARGATPATGHVLLDATPGRLTLTTTDLTLALMTAVVAEVARPGRALLPAGLLGDYAASLPGGPVRLTAEPERGRVRARSGRASAGFAALAATDFPAPPAPDPATGPFLDAAALRQAFARVTPAAARDEAHPVLGAVHLTLDVAALTLTATDGCRLASARVSITADSGVAWQALLPARAAQEAIRLLGEAETMRVMFPPGERGLWLVAGASGLYTRLVEGAFPDTAGLVPPTWRTRVTVAGAALRDALRQADLFGQDAPGPRPVVLATAPGRLAVGAWGGERGEIHSELPAELEGAPGMVVLDTRLVVDLLAGARAARLTLRWAGPEGAVVVREAGEGTAPDEPVDGDLWLVMPLREPRLLRRQADADEAARVETQLITPGAEAAA